MGPYQQIAILVAVAVSLCALAASLFHVRRDPVKREQKRRLNVARLGRMGDGMITDVHDATIFYSYDLHGVVYSTSQDVTQLKTLLPPDAATLIGPVTIKYLPRNPANSIVVCEQWSGFMRRPPISKGA